MKAWQYFGAIGAALVGTYIAASVLTAPGPRDIIPDVNACAARSGVSAYVASGKVHYIGSNRQEFEFEKCMDSRGWSMAGK